MKKIFLILFFSISFLIFIFLSYKIFEEYSYKRAKTTGDFYEKSGELDRAILEYKKAEYLNPNSLFIHNKLAFLFYKKNALKEAIEEMEKSLKIDNKNAENYHQLAIFYYEKDNPVKARDNAEKALLLNLKNEDFLSDFHLIQQEAKYEKKLKTLESEHFIVKYNPLYEKSYAKLILSIMEDSYKKIGRCLSLLPQEKIVLKIYNDDTFFKITESSSDIIAASINNKMLLRSPRFLPIGKTIRETLTHEYLHIILHILIKEEIPTWFNEGIADYFSQEELTLEQSERLRRAIKNSKIISLKELEKSWGNFPVDKLHLSYAESYSFICFFADKYGWKKITELIKNFSSGKKIEDAFLNIGLNYSIVENEWKENLNKIFSN